MEDIENYSIFGINLGGGKKPQSGSGDAENAGFLSGILGGAILGLGLQQLFGSADEITGNRLKEIFADFEKRRAIDEKLQNIKWRIDAGNETDIYGAILILFSEMEKFIDALSKKFLDYYYQQHNFRDKVHALQNKMIITNFESDTLRNTIYPKRNLISHGNYNNVNKAEVLQCYDFISQFMKKYNALLQS